MTNEGYEWFQKTCLYARYVPDGAQRSEVAEFWITVFRSTVVKRAKDRCRHAVNRPCFGCLGIAFTEHSNDTREMPRNT